MGSDSETRDEAERPPHIGGQPVVSHGSKRVVEVASEHQQLTKDLAEVMVRPKMPRARLVVYAWQAQRRPCQQRWDSGRGMA